MFICIKIDEYMVYIDVCIHICTSIFRYSCTYFDYVTILPAQDEANAKEKPGELR